jgi:hypothetical protein
LIINGHISNDALVVYWQSKNYEPKVFPILPGQKHKANFQRTLFDIPLFWNQLKRPPENNKKNVRIKQKIFVDRP